MHIRKHVVAVSLVLSFPGAARAQADSASRGEVFGTVYDSVARTMVVGATVQLVSPTNPGQDIHGATTDSRGRYVIPGIPPGRYVIGFQHPALDSLALESPLQLVEVRAAERTRADLAVPSPRRIVASLCGRGADADSTGLLIGLLRDARTGMPVDTGGVEARWNELEIGPAGINQTARQIVAWVGADGWFALCGVPVIDDLVFFGWHGRDSTGATFVAVPANGLTRHDLFVGGTARVRGMVRSDRDRPLANARVALANETRIVATDSSGLFTLGGVPAGTQTLQVRAIGYAPEQRQLVLAADADTTLQIRLTTVSRVLDTIQVISRRIYDADRSGFARRRRMGFGRFFDENDIRRRRPYDLYSLLREVSFMRLVGNGLDRRLVMGGRGRPCEPELYLNGVHMPRDLLGELDFLVRPEEVGGMEVYTSSSQTPAQFTSFDACGAIVIWTRPALGEARAK
jgi:hypothetical protein